MCQFSKNFIGFQGDRNTMDVHCENKAVGFGECVSTILQGNDITQTVNCITVGTSGYTNFALGDHNIQIMNCNSVGNDGCQNNLINLASSLDPYNDNTQKINCLFVSRGCANSSLDNGNNQDLRCVCSTQCTNEIDGPLTVTHRRQYA